MQKEKYNKAIILINGSVLATVVHYHLSYIVSVKLANNRVECEVSWDFKY